MSILGRSFLVKILALMGILTLLSGCASPCCDGTGTFDHLQGVSNCCGKAVDSTGINAIRQQALQETAMSLGAQASLAERSKQINCILAKNSKNLDRIFNFNLMMLPHNVLPPVLDQGENSLALDDPQTIRIADRTYQIISQARFVTTPPNWRDYLWQTYPIPDAPYSTLCPKNAAERSIWKCYAALGWQQGITQANQIYAANLARLKRDFSGMVRYRALLVQHMVSPPFVSRTELGITGTCSDMRINDQVLRITALPCLQTNSKCWKTVIDQGPCQ